MLKFPIYLDYSATTPVDPRVAAKMIPYLTEHFGNPASRSHAYGWEAEKAVEDAREQVAALVGADPKEIIWTSGATESNNLAIKGAAHFYAGKGKHLITRQDRAQGRARHLPRTRTPRFRGDLPRSGAERSAEHREVQAGAAPGHDRGLGDVR